MSKYTKAQRHSIYCFMLAEAMKPSLISDNLGSTFAGICWLYYCILDDCSFFVSMERNFPEVWKRKPEKTIGAYFFSCDKSGWKKRKQLLRECIKETADF